MTNNQQYVIRGGSDGRERLRILARVMQPTTLSLFDQIGLESGVACLDFGCGGGDVSFDLARLVGSTGTVLGVDMDAEGIAIAKREAELHNIDNVSFEISDITEWQTDSVYDLAYGRFILTHLQNPAKTLSKLFAKLQPGAAMVVEDIDFAGNFCYPASSAFDRYLELYREIVHRAGADPNIGPRLPRLLLEANFENVQMNVVQPAGLQGEVKIIQPLTMEYIRTPVLAHKLATEQEIDEIVEELYTYARDPYTVLSLPRVVQAWGYRPKEQG
jgi:SAM-dependent methyltransferase